MSDIVYSPMFFDDFRLHHVLASSGIPVGRASALFLALSKGKNVVIPFLSLPLARSAFCF